MQPIIEGVPPTKGQAIHKLNLLRCEVQGRLATLEGKWFCRRQRALLTAQDEVLEAVFWALMDMSDE